MEKNKIKTKQLLSANINKYLIISIVIVFGIFGLAKSSLAANGDELNTVQNCTAPAGVTEANVTTGWTNAACSSMISDTDDPQLGTYDLKAVTHTTFGCSVNFLYPTLTEATTYKLTIYAKIAAGAQSWACYSNKLQHQTIGTAYTKVEQIFHGASSGRVYCYENSPYSTGDAIHIDNLSVTPVTPCFGSETDTVSQAASPVNEANSTAGWYTFGSLDSFTSESSGCADGSYCLKAVQSTVLGGVAGFSMDLGSAPFSLISGHKYFIVYNLKHTGVGSQSWSCGFTDTPSGIDNEPFNQVFSGRTYYLPAGLQLDYTGTTRYFTCQEQAPGYQDGSGIYLDGFSVKEIISSGNEICGDDTTPPAAPSGLLVQ